MLCPLKMALPVVCPRTPMLCTRHQPPTSSVVLPPPLCCGPRCCVPRKSPPGGVSPHSDAVYPSPTTNGISGAAPPTVLRTAMLCPRQIARPQWCVPGACPRVVCPRRRPSGVSPVACPQWCVPAPRYCVPGANHQRHQRCCPPLLCCGPGCCVPGKSPDRRVSPVCVPGVCPRMTGPCHDDRRHQLHQPAAPAFWRRTNR
jgi:hypothetical protein